jgi:hypothetical protein
VDGSLVELRVGEHESGVVVEDSAETLRSDRDLLMASYFGER